MKTQIVSDLGIFICRMCGRLLKLADLPCICGYDGQLKKTHVHLPVVETWLFLKIVRTQAFTQLEPGTKPAKTQKKRFALLIDSPGIEDNGRIRARASRIPR